MSDNEGAHPAARAGARKTEWLQDNHTMTGPGVPDAAIAVLARLVAGSPADPATIAALAEPWHDVAEQIGKVDGEGRLPAFQAAVRGWPNAGDVLRTVLAADPNMPPGGAARAAILSARDILTRVWPEPVWAVPQLLPVGLGVLAGRPKLGKSWLALQVACAVATGGMVFGQRVQRGKVLYLALEDPPRRLKSRMIAQSWPADADADFLCIGEFAKAVGDLAAGGADRLAELIAAEHYRLVVIDTLSRAIVTDQNDSTAVTQALTPVQEMAHSCEAVVLLVDHHRKPGVASSSDLVADIMGATAKGAMADVIWGLYRERGKVEALLAVTGRDVEEHELALQWDVLTGCWQCLGEAGQVRRDTVQGEILDAIQTLDELSVPATTTAIAQHLSKDPAQISRELAELVARGKVVRLPREGKAQPYGLPVKQQHD
jgi:hypothetical protein